MAETKCPVNKVILVGDFGVGKTSIFRRFVQNIFIEEVERQSSIGLDHFDKEYNVNSQKLKVQLWDTGGMERIASVTSSYYKHSNAAILVYSVNNFESFNTLSQHILEIVSYAETAKIFLCGTKIDIKDEIVITEKDADDFCQQCQNLISGCYQISSKTGEGVHEMMKDIARVISLACKQVMDPDILSINPPHSNEEKKKCAC